MLSKTVNEYGSITIDNEVIARIAGLAAMDCYGIVGMAAKNMKDGITKLLKIESLTKGVKLNLTEEECIIDLHIIVEYGTNISAIADTLINTVKYRVLEYAGFAITEVNIFVEGIRVNN